MCGFVLYDTQVIIEKRRAGDKDFVAHSVDLFIDFISIFRRLLVILAQNANSEKVSYRQGQSSYFSGQILRSLIRQPHDSIIILYYFYSSRCHEISWIRPVFVAFASQNVLGWSLTFRKCFTSLRKNFIILKFFAESFCFLSRPPLGEDLIFLWKLYNNGIWNWFFVVYGHKTAARFLYSKIN